MAKATKTRLAVSAAPPDSNGPVLGTAQQREAEGAVLRLLTDRGVRAAMAAVREELASDPTAQSEAGKATLDRAVTEFTTSLILLEYAGDPRFPRFVWTPENTSHSWFGYEMPASAMGGDNPDQIYRQAFLDGAGHYVVSGRIDPSRRPTQQSFSIDRNWVAGVPPVRPKGKIFLGSYQVALRNLDSLKIAPDGTFQFTIGPDERPDDPDHVTLEPGNYLILSREIMSDWCQRPGRLQIDRVDPLSASPRTDAEFKSLVLQHLHDYVHYWGTFHHIFLGGPPANVPAGPFPREGGIGYLAGVRYQLQSGQVAVLTIDRRNAAYIGVQSTDPWFVSPDSRHFQTSLNTSQSVPNADGTFTYAVSPVDPGVANWIDTAGLYEGILIARWMKVPEGQRPEDMMHSYAVVNHAELGTGALANIPRITPQGRQAQIQRRTREYDRRLGH
jgi:hypothetical protein